MGILLTETSKTQCTGASLLFSWSTVLLMTALSASVKPVCWSEMEAFVRDYLQYLCSWRRKVACLWMQNVHLKLSASKCSHATLNAGFSCTWHPSSNPLNKEEKKKTKAAQTSEVFLCCQLAAIDSLFWWYDAIL